MSRLRVFGVEVVLISNIVCIHSYTPSVSKQKLRSDIICVTKQKCTFGEISLKLHQTNWNVARNNVNVVVDELPSQSTNNLHLFNN
jgi:hypothetical protein